MTFYTGFYADLDHTERLVMRAFLDLLGERGCSVCCEIKPLADFPGGGTSSAYYCNACDRARASARRARRTEHECGCVTPASFDALRAGLCAYCRAAPVEDVDHVEPLARGGWHCLSNLVGACMACNRSKHARSVDEFLASRRARGLPAYAPSLPACLAAEDRLSSDRPTRTPIPQTAPTPDKEPPMTLSEIADNPLLDDVLDDVEAELHANALPGPGPVEREVMREMVDSVIASSASAYRASGFDPYEGTVDEDVDVVGAW